MHNGIIEDLAIAEYHADHAVSKSGLNLLLQKSPAHYFDQYRNPNFKKPKPSREKIFGQAFHDFVLEPKIYAQRYVTALPINKNKAAYKIWAKAHEEAGKVIMDEVEIEKLHLMHAKLHGHPEAAPLLPANNPDAMVETSFFWIDPITGIRCKCRTDIFLPKKRMIVPDLKTCLSVRKDVFRRDIQNWGYHIQDAAYVTGVNLLWPEEVTAFPFICIEKTPPFCVKVYHLNPSYKQLGYMDYRRAIEMVDQCEKSGVWPEYQDDGPGIDAPDRMMRDMNLTNDEQEEEVGYEPEEYQAAG